MGRLVNWPKKMIFGVRHLTSGGGLGLGILIGIEIPIYFWGGVQGPKTSKFSMKSNKNATTRINI